MKAVIFAIALLGAGPALADAGDDYVACLIGRSAVALGQQAVKDANEAQYVAYSQCAEPEDYGSSEPDGVVDFVNQAVEALAKAL